MNRSKTEDVMGFTLVEVLVSLAILAVSLAALLNTFSESLQQSRESEAQSTAGLLAQSLLASAGRETSMTVGEVDGSSGDRFMWHLHVADFGDQDDRLAWPMRAYRISVEVYWWEGRFIRSVSAETLKLGPKEPR